MISFPDWSLNVQRPESDKEQSRRTVRLCGEPEGGREWGAWSSVVISQHLRLSLRCPPKAKAG